MNDKFQSAEELYQRVLPALHSKVDEFVRNGINFITEDDIWFFLVDKWKKSIGLTLFDVVDDILKLDVNFLLDNYNQFKDYDNRE